MECAWNAWCLIRTIAYLVNIMYALDMAWHLQQCLFFHIGKSENSKHITRIMAHCGYIEMEFLEATLRVLTTVCLPKLSPNR